MATVSQNLRWSSPPYVASSSSSSFTPASCSCRTDCTGTSEHDLAEVCHDDDVAPGGGTATNAGVTATLHHIVVARTARATRRMSRRPEHHPVLYYPLAAALPAAATPRPGTPVGRLTAPQNVFPRSRRVPCIDRYITGAPPPPPGRCCVKPASLATRLLSRTVTLKHGCRWNMPGGFSLQ